MNTHTYSERRQAIYFHAGRELYRLAAAILDDVTEDAEFLGETETWVKGVVKATCEKARDEYQKGHEECIATAHAETANHKAAFVHSQALNRYLNRKRAAEDRAAFAQGTGVGSWK
jgi:hypothetical protein